jgi:hypothetical protein
MDKPAFPPELCLLIAEHLDFFAHDRLRRVGVFAYKLLTTDESVLKATKQTFPLVSEWPPAMPKEMCAKLAFTYFRERPAVNRGQYEANLAYILQTWVDENTYYAAFEVADMMGAFECKAGRDMLRLIAAEAPLAPVYPLVRRRGHIVIPLDFIVNGILGSKHLDGLRALAYLAQYAFAFDPVTGKMTVPADMVAVVLGAKASFLFHQPV